MIEAAAGIEVADKDAVATRLKPSQFAKRPHGGFHVSVGVCRPDSDSFDLLRSTP